MSPQSMAKLIAGAVLVFALILTGASSTYVVEPGHRGVLITLGKVSPAFKPEGFGMKLPFVSTVLHRPVRQLTAQMEAECYSSDLQQIRIHLKILYRVPEVSVVRLYREVQGEPFEALIQPRVAEAIKEVTALRSAEQIVQKREEVKSRAFEIARHKIGDLLLLEDVVLEDMNLTKVLETAIEQKMVQQQEAARARFAQVQAQTEANTAVIKAKGEAEAIQLRGKALRDNPDALRLQVMEHWDGVTPLVVGPDVAGTEMILPLGTLSTTNFSTRKP
jgi:prohibitin 2